MGAERAEIPITFSDVTSWSQPEPDIQVLSRMSLAGHPARAN